MRPLSSAEIDRMISTAASSFSDLCTVGVPSVTRNDFGEEVSTFTAGSPIPCRFELVGGSEESKGGLIVTKTRAYFSLPIDTNVSIRDCLTLTKCYGKSVNHRFEVVSEPVKNLDCIRVECVYVGV